MSDKPRRVRGKSSGEITMNHICRVTVAVTVDVDRADVSEGEQLLNEYGARSLAAAAIGRVLAESSLHLMRGVKNWHEPRAVAGCTEAV